MTKLLRLWIFQALCLFLVLTMPSVAVSASEFEQPWNHADSAIVIDPYPLNPIDWAEIAKNPKIAGFIHKATEGMPPRASCSGLEGDTRRSCLFERKYYSTGIELFKTRRYIAKRSGYKWGAYHLGRPGNPEGQARHFLDVAEPEVDDLLALDIEDIDSEKWMSLDEAEVFVKYVHREIGRYPLLYVNHKVASHIAKNSDRYPLLSKLGIWYARFKSDIRDVFPLGPYKTYSLWQFKSEINCFSKEECPYHLAGTHYDMDLNIYPESVDRLKAKWPKIER